MEDFIKEQITLGLKSFSGNLVKSLFIPSSSKETEKRRKQGFICGVCHPNGDTDLIKGANIEWIRIDIPFPFDQDGNETESSRSFKARAKRFADAGIKVMAVTPYHHDYTANGIVITSREGEKRIREIAFFLLNDLRGLVSGYQVANEMGIPRFTVPLTVKQGARFIGIQLEAMFPHRGDAIIGYNAAGPQPNLQVYMKPYYKYCDYVGYDLYMGCFFNMPGFMFIFDVIAKYLWACTGRPILLQEFGYISEGAPKTKEEKREIIRGYGFDNEKEARKNIVAFVDNLPEYMQEHIKRVCQNNESKYLDFVFNGDYKNHIYRELPKLTKIPGYPHTPQGQADFYRDILKRLYKQKCLIGAIVYCWQDSGTCYVCGQSDCPTETRWGLVDMDGNPKPSYYAVRDALAEIKSKQR